MNLSIAEITLTFLSTIATDAFATMVPSILDRRGFLGSLTRGPLESIPIPI